MPPPTPPPSLQRVGKPLIALLLSGIVLALSWLAVSQWQSTSSRDAMQRLRVDAARLHQFDAILLYILDAESGVRAFMVTDNPVYLGPYQNNRVKIETIIGAMREDFELDSEQHALLDRLPPLIEARWHVLQAGIAHRSWPDVGAADGGAPKRLTEDIRGIVDDLRQRTLDEVDRRVVASFARFERVQLMNRVLGAGVLALLCILVVVVYRQLLLRERLALMLRSENARLQEEVAGRTSELTSLATYLTNVREVEKARLARELHDELGSLMTAAKLDAGWIARKLPTDAMGPIRDRLERLVQTLNEGIALKRRVVADLRPPLLADLGLVEALRSLAESAELSEFGGQLEVELPDELPELPAQVSLALFRIAQEGLTNARRHAGAAHARLSLKVEDRKIVLRVEDDGRGFAPASLGNARHGLAGMGHRAQMLAGTLLVRSSPGNGTLIEAQIPLPAAP